MGILVYLVILLAMAGTSNATYCICKGGLNETYYQAALDYACGAGADCNPIIENGACFEPNTKKAHCDFAVNSYFQRMGQVPDSCVFRGVAKTTASASDFESQNTKCTYQSSPSSTTTGNGSATPSTTPISTNPTFGSGTTGTTSGMNPVFGTGMGPSATITDSRAANSLLQTTSLALSLISSLCFLSLLLPGN